MEVGGVWVSLEECLLVVFGESVKSIKGRSVYIFTQRRRREHNAANMHQSSNVLKVEVGVVEKGKEVFEGYIFSTESNFVN